MCDQERLVVAKLVVGHTHALLVCYGNMAVTEWWFSDGTFINMTLSMVIGVQL